MKVTTLFDEVEVKDKLPRTPIAKLRSALLKDLNESIYKFKIRYNRVFYEKVANFPKGITRDSWLELADKIW